MIYDTVTEVKSTSIDNKPSRAVTMTVMSVTFPVFFRRREYLCIMWLRDDGLIALAMNAS